MPAQASGSRLINHKWIARSCADQPAQRRRYRVHSGQRIAAALQLAVSDVCGAHPSILAGYRPETRERIVTER
jgi:hypothetical protein